MNSRFWITWFRQTVEHKKICRGEENSWTTKQTVELTGSWTEELLNRRTEELKNSWTYIQLNRRTVEQKNSWTEEQLNRRIVEHRKNWTDKQLNIWPEKQPNRQGCYSKTFFSFLYRSFFRRGGGALTTLNSLETSWSLFRLRPLHNTTILVRGDITYNWFYLKIMT